MDAAEIVSVDCNNLILGAPRCGKTRLVKDVCAEALARGLRVTISGVTTRCTQLINIWLDQLREASTKKNFVRAVPLHTLLGLRDAAAVPKTSTEFVRLRGSWQKNQLARLTSYATADLLIIDGAHMMSAQLLRMLDMWGRELRSSARTLKTHARSIAKHAAVGGLRLLFVGDVYALPPMFDQPHAFMSDEWTNMACTVTTLGELPLHLDELITTTDVASALAPHVVTTLPATDRMIQIVASNARADSIIESKIETNIHRTFVHDIFWCASGKKRKDMESCDEARTSSFLKQMGSLAARTCPLVVCRDGLKLYLGQYVMLCCALGRIPACACGVVDAFTPTSVVVDFDNYGKRDVGWKEFVFHKTSDLEVSIMQLPLRPAAALTLYQVSGMELDTTVVVHASALRSSFHHVYTVMSRCKHLDRFFVYNSDGGLAPIDACSAAVRSFAQHTEERHASREGGEDEVGEDDAF